jgi:MFS family permease
MWYRTSRAQGRVPRETCQTIKDSMNNRTKAWAVTLAVFLASVAVAANRFKPPPVMQVLIADLNVDMVTGGWFMGVASLASVALAIPTAFILTRLGLRLTGTIALGCTVAGAVLGALAHNAEMMLAGRIVEGFSIGLIAVVAPTAISMWFEPRERGMPLGLWATWVPVGNVIMFNVAHPLLNAFGWQAVWWFGALLAAVALGVFAVVVTEPQQVDGQADAAGRNGTRSSLRAFMRTLLSLPAWLLGLSFGLFGFAVIGYNTWAPAYLNEALSIAPATASFYASLMFLAAIPGNLAAGWAVDRTSRRHALLTAAFAVTGLMLAWSFGLGAVWMVAPYMLTMGFFSNWIPTVTFTLAPEKIPSVEFAGLGLAIAISLGNVGSLVGPPVLAAAVEGGEWTAGSTLVVLAMAAGGLATLGVWWLARRPAAPARATT